MNVRIAPKGDSYGPLIPQRILDDMKVEREVIIHSDLTTYNLRAMNQYGREELSTYSILADLIPVLHFLQCPNLLEDAVIQLVDTLPYNVNVNNRTRDIILNTPHLRMIITLRLNGRKLPPLNLKCKFCRRSKNRVTVDDELLKKYVNQSHKSRSDLTIHLIEMGLELDQIYKSVNNYRYIDDVLRHFIKLRDREVIDWILSNYHPIIIHNRYDRIKTITELMDLNIRSSSIFDNIELKYGDIDEVIDYSPDNSVMTEYLIDNYPRCVTINENIIKALLPDRSSTSILALLKRLGINWDNRVIEWFFNTYFSYFDLEVIDWILTTKSNVHYLHELIIKSNNHQFIDLLFEKGSNKNYLELALNQSDTYTLSKIDLEHLPSDIITLELNDICRVEHIKIMKKCKNPQPIISLILALITHCRTEDLEYIIDNELRLAKLVIQLIQSDGDNLIIHLRDKPGILEMVSFIMRYCTNIRIGHLIQYKVVFNIIRHIIESNDREFANKAINDIRELYPPLPSNNTSLNRIAASNRARILDPIVELLMEKIKS